MFKRKLISILILVISVFFFCGCASVIEYLNRPDEVHERINKEAEEQMKHFQEINAQNQ